MMLAGLVLREHISIGLASGLAIALTGVTLVVYEPGATGDSLGITLTVVSIGFCALYSVLTRRLLLDDSTLTVLLAQQVAALGFAVILASLVEVTGSTGWDVGGLSAGAVLGRPHPACCTTASASGSS
jgi:probable blue pigment (indigoidine) exporter